MGCSFHSIDAKPVFSHSCQCTLYSELYPKFFLDIAHGRFPLVVQAGVYSIVTCCVFHSEVSLHRAEVGRTLFPLSLSPAWVPIRLHQQKSPLATTHVSWAWCFRSERLSLKLSDLYVMRHLPPRDSSKVSILGRKWTWRGWITLILISLLPSRVLFHRWRLPVLHTVRQDPGLSHPSLVVYPFTMI